MLHLLDLFSGIGGFSLGLERSGHFRTVAFCEIDPWPRGVLRRHWPDVPIYEDVRDLTAARLRADGIRVDAMCGGFPCQDISVAGKGAGLDGERSGLWREYSRLVGELRPSVVFVENVGALRGRGLAAVLGDLAALGYDAQWHAVPAAAVGAPHLRDRVWIVAALADAASIGLRRGSMDGSQRTEPAGSAAADAQRDLSERLPEPAGDRRSSGAAEGQAPQRERLRAESGAVGNAEVGGAAADTDGAGQPELRGLFGRLARALAATAAPWERTAEPPLRRMDDGPADGVDRRRWARQDRARLKALGNAVVPAIPEILGRCVMGEFA